MRDIAIIIGVLLLALVIGAVLFLYNPNPSAVPASANAYSSGAVTAASASPDVRDAALGAASAVPFTVLAQGATSPDDFDKVNYRIQTADQFADLWSMVYGDTATPPSVDFSDQEVLAVFDGSHATGGYAIAVTSIADDDSRTVTVEHDSPGDSCMTTEAQSSPFEIVAVSKTALPIVHNDTSVTNECQ